MQASKRPAHGCPSPPMAITITDVDNLYRAHGHHLLRVARRLVTCEQTAQDLVSDAFVGLICALASGRGPTSSARGYLARSVHHGAMRAWRQRDRRPRLAVPLGSGEMEDHLIEAAVVRGAFQSLPTRWQHVLWLTIVEDWPLSQVAEALDMPSAGAVAVLAQRARTGLRKALDTANRDTQP